KSKVATASLRAGINLAGTLIGRYGPDVGETFRSSFARLPATTVYGGTSLVTTLPAPTKALSPMVTPQRITAPLPIDAPRHTQVSTTFQSAFASSLPLQVTAPG